MVGLYDVICLLVVHFPVTEEANVTFRNNSIYEVLGKKLRFFSRDGKK